MNLWFIFLTGLTTGALSCLAVQGGLLASVIANQSKSDRQSPQNQDSKAVAMFLLAKIIAHTILGFLLGSLGSAFQLSLGMRLFFQIFTALFMLATAANLLNLHPIFRYVVIQPPAMLRKMIKKSSKNTAWFSPFILGFFTIFIPCGVTQAVEILVITNGSPVTGAAAMFAFVLGTMPLFATIGLATAKLSARWYQIFTKGAVTILVLMSLYSINGVLQVIDSPVSWQKGVLAYQKLQQYEKGTNGKNLVAIVNGVQQVSIQVTSGGYMPKYFTVKAGVPVELTLQTNDVYTCASAFTFRAFNIYTNLKSTDQKTFTLTPDKKGKFTFACSMGMYTGVMQVI